MINQFLTKLDNRNTSFSGIARDASVPVPYTGSRLRLWTALFSEVGAEEHFRTAVAALKMLRVSPWMKYETLADGRITYTEQELSDVLIGSAEGVEISDPSMLFVQGPETDSKITWTLRTDGVTVRATTGSTTITAPFAIGQAVDLPNSDSSMTFVMTPPLNTALTITRNVQYVIQLPAVEARLDALPEKVWVDCLPADIDRSKAKQVPIARAIMTVALATVGIANG